MKPQVKQDTIVSCFPFKLTGVNRAWTDKSGPHNPNSSVVLTLKDF